jgi:DNA-binding transcriptional regulator LsrR (DeoR family)
LGSLNGTLTAGVGAVVQYFFGKNKDSAAHNQMLSESIPFSQLDKIKSMLGIANGNGKKE